MAKPLVPTPADEHAAEAYADKVAGTETAPPGCWGWSRKDYLAGVLAERAKTTWRDIATAPKDGTLFLAYAEAGQHGLPELYSLCSWNEFGGFCICELRNATHWMPLPAGPLVPPRGAGEGRVT